MAAAVVAQHTKGAVKARQLRRPHVHVCPQRVREHQHRRVGRAVETVRNAAAIVGIDELLAHPSISPFAGLIGTPVFACTSSTAIPGASSISDKRPSSLSIA